MGNDRNKLYDTGTFESAYDAITINDTILVTLIYTVMFFLSTSTSTLNKAEIK